MKKRWSIPLKVSYVIKMIRFCNSSAMGFPTNENMSLLTYSALECELTGVMIQTVKSLN